VAPSGWIGLFSRSRLRAHDTHGRAPGIKNLQPGEKPETITVLPTDPITQAKLAKCAQPCSY
jgi:hypothetical protein